MKSRYDLSNRVLLATSGEQSRGVTIAYIVWGTHPSHYSTPIRKYSAPEKGSYCLFVVCSVFCFCFFNKASYSNIT